MGATELLETPGLLTGAGALVLIASEVDGAGALALAHWKRPLLILHAVEDEKVPIDRAETLFRAAAQPKSFAALEAGDHLLTERRHAEHAAQLIAEWAAPRWPAESRAPHEKDKHGDVTVSWLGHGLAHVVHAPPHQLLADEPPELGGEERGPNPYDFLLGALGACTAMTLRMYANLKKWPLEGLSVRLRHARIYAKDCEGCETTEGMIDRIEREIHFEGPLTEEQLGRLVEIANKCPVHKTLTAEIRIPTKRMS